MVRLVNLNTTDRKAIGLIRILRAIVCQSSTLISRKRPLFRVFSLFYRIEPVRTFIQMTKFIRPIIPTPNHAISTIVISTKACRANIFCAMSISISMNNDVEIVICQQTPTFGTNSLVVRLNLICTALGIALAR